MNDYALLALTLVAPAVLYLLGALRVLPESRRIAVFRGGALHRVAGPGLAFTVPFLERAVVVDLARRVPGWQSLSEAQVAERVRALVSQEKATSPS